MTKFTYAVLLSLFMFGCYPAKEELIKKADAGDLNVIIGDKKYQDLFLTVQKLGNREALLELFKYYDYKFDTSLVSHDVARKIYRAKLEKIRDKI